MAAPQNAGILRRILGSLAIAAMLLFWDVVMFGSYLMSMFFCPIWLVASLLKNLIQLPGWGIALFRLAMPVVTWGVVMANSDFQLKRAEENAQQVVAACEQFDADHGRFPKSLDELVPEYMPSVPTVKYASGHWGRFIYISGPENALLGWYVVPPYLRKTYDFENRQWRYID